jgi:hypothetical protein
MECWGRIELMKEWNVGMLEGWKDGRMVENIFSIFRKRA